MGILLRNLPGCVLGLCGDVGIDRSTALCEYVIDEYMEFHNGITKNQLTHKHTTPYNILARPTRTAK